MKFLSRPSSSGTIRFLLTCCLFGCFLWWSCQKSGDNPITPPDTSNEDDIADLVATVIGNAQSTNGLTAQIAGAAHLAAGDTLGKLVPHDYVMTIPAESSFVVTKTKTTGTYLFSITYNYHYAFDSDHRDSLAFDYSSSGEYNSDRMYGSYNDNCAFTVTGIRGALSYYVIDNGIYDRIISDTLKLRDHRALSGSITLEVGQLSVSKLSRSILSGTIAVSVSFDTPDGGSIDTDAQLTFMPVDQATLVVNGRSYNINCTTAHATYITP